MRTVKLEKLYSYTAAVRIDAGTPYLKARKSCVEQAMTWLIQGRNRRVTGLRFNEYREDRADGSYAVCECDVLEEVVK